MIPRADVTGIVLCGGAGRRMGGVQKALLALHGRPLVAHVAERLAPQVARIIVSANAAHDAYGAYGTPVADITADLGPLGGLQAALRLVDTPWCFCCPGDAPRLDRTVVSRLAAAIGHHDVAVAHDGIRQQHLVMLCRVSVQSPLDAYLASGERTVRGFVDGLSGVEVPMPDLVASFANVNTPDDLAALQDPEDRAPEP